MCMYFTPMFITAHTVPILHTVIHVSAHPYTALSIHRPDIYIWKHFIHITHNFIPLFVLPFSLYNVKKQQLCVLIVKACKAKVEVPLLC